MAIAPPALLELGFVGPKITEPVKDACKGSCRRPNTTLSEVTTCISSFDGSGSPSARSGLEAFGRPRKLLSTGDCAECRFNLPPLTETDDCIQCPDPVGQLPRPSDAISLFCYSEDSEVECA